MKFNQIILLVLLASILMGLLYQLLVTIDHHGSDKSIFLLLTALLTDFIIMVGSFLFFMRQPTEKN